MSYENSTSGLIWHVLCGAMVNTKCRAAGHEAWRGGAVVGRTGITFRSHVMLHWALTFLVIALIAAVFGFGGIAGTAAGIAKILFFVFLVLFVISLLFGRRASI